MKKSANQLFKESNSELPFKDWLKTQQKDGALENHDKMFNANGEENIEDSNELETNDVQEAEVVVKKTKSTTSIKAKNKGILNLIGLISLGVFIYGLHKATQQEA
tara:strand:- start:19 stop:333 length:315 start_codon:yes stop_codon:yes gene_type:complete